jgi:ABC-type polar amino acid transport system ATPase subunit
VATKANATDLALKAQIDSPTFTGTVAGITKAMVGLGSVNNTSDLAKPISTTTQEALDTKVSTSTFSTTVATKANATDLALKAPIDSPTFTGTVSGITKTMVGLSNVENTSDLEKPISTLTQAALDTKISASSLSSTFSSKENSDNKSMATDLGGNTTNDILFPTQKAVKSYVDAQINSGGVQDGGILTRHLADGAVSGIKLASEISGFKRFVDGAGSVTLSSTITTDVDVNAGNLAIGGTSNWQSFTAGSSGKLSSIEFQTVNPSSSGPAPVAYVEIYNGQGLSGALLGTSANFPISGMGRNWYAFDLGSTSISLVGGSVYTARLVVNTSNQNYVYGDNALYNGGISNISSNWDFNIKTKMRQFSNDTFLTTSAANGLYGSLVSNATHTGEVTGATALTITDGAVTSAKIANSAVDLTTKVTGVLPTTNIADGAITTAKIANSAVDLTTKVTGVLPTANVADGAITTAKIANSAVDLATKVTGVLPTANGGTGTLTATANTFFAAPNGANGAPIFRSLVASDLPTLTSSYIANNSSTPQSANINIAGDAVIVGTISASSAIFSNTTAGSSIVGTLSSGQDITVNGKTIGSGAGNKITNAVFGKDALISNTTGEWNTAIGLETLKNNKNGSNNTAIGKFSLHDNISGSNNTAIGEESMYKNTIGVNNYAHGYLTLYSNTSGSFNIVNGTNALVYNTTGSSNIAYGVSSMFNSISGDQNVAIGNMTLNDNISGSNNVAIGKESFKNNTTGSNNTAIGALTNVSSGTLSNSTAIGYGAIVDESNKIQLGNTNVLKVNTSGVFSAASIQNTPIGSTTRNTGAFTMLTSSSDASIGGTLTVTGVTTFTSTPVLLSSTASRALFTNNNKQVVSNNITGTGDVVMSIAPTLTGTITLESLSSTSDITVNGKKIGRGAGNNSTSTVFGLNALVNNTDGYNNNAIGDLALQKNTIGNNNTAIGYNALNSNTSGSNNIANGNSTLLSNTTGSNNIANGIGALERNTSGNSNIANGTNVLLNNLTGSDNIANGRNTLFSNTSGSRNIANGSTALYFNTTGNDNFASGVGALKNNNADYNIAIGKESLNNNTSGSNNIAYGNINATDEEIIEAAKFAEIDQFINSLENKYNTTVGENGVKLSGGQKQRISIARAILKKSPIILLDEATSSLDSEAEEKISHALDNLTKNKTTLIISHKLSSIINCDKIYVINNGKIIGEGSNSELLKNSIAYKNLYKKQSLN